VTESGTAIDEMRLGCRSEFPSLIGAKETLSFSTLPSCAETYSSKKQSRKEAGKDEEERSKQQRGESVKAWDNRAARAVLLGPGHGSSSQRQQSSWQGSDDDAHDAVDVERRSEPARLLIPGRISPGTFSLYALQRIQVGRVHQRRWDKSCSSTHRAPHQDPTKGTAVLAS